DPVADHFAAAMGASRRQRVDGALERVERVVAPRHRHGERLVVIIAAHVSLGHRLILQRGLAATERGPRALSLPPTARRSSPVQVTSRKVEVTSLTSYFQLPPCYFCLRVLPSVVSRPSNNEEVGSWKSQV